MTDIDTSDISDTPGMSAAERDVRKRLADARAEIERLRHELNAHKTVNKIHYDLLREIVRDDPDKWSFDALLFMVKRLLAEVYPPDVFTGESANTPGNEGVTFVVTLRKVIAEIEAKG